MLAFSRYTPVILKNVYPGHSLLQSQMFLFCFKFLFFCHLFMGTTGSSNPSSKIFTRKPIDSFLLPVHSSFHSALPLRKIQKDPLPLSSSKSFTSSLSSPNFFTLTLPLNSSLRLPSPIIISLSPCFLQDPDREENPQA
jgi:hypothetical protein